MNEGANEYPTIQPNFDFNSQRLLFHYTSFVTALEFIVPNRSLRLSRLKDTHDPTEYKHWLISAVGWDLPEDYLDTDRIVAQSIDKYRRQNAHIACFSTNQSQKVPNHVTSTTREKQIFGYLRSRMWSQYAESHRGVCLVFDRHLLFEEAKASVCDNNLIDSNDVEYSFSDEIDRVFINGNQARSRPPEEFAKEFVWSNRKHFFFTKDYDYRDEAEHRLVVLAEQLDAVTISVSKSLVAVIVGDSYPDSFIPLLVHHTSRHGICRRRLYWSNRKPYLVFLTEEDSRVADRLVNTDT